MPLGHDPQETGDRVERLLDEIAAAADSGVQQRAEELVRALMELYGAGLTRIIELVDETGSERMLEAMTSDELVMSLLALHELHPQDVIERVGTALDQVRPYLGSHAGGVEFLGVDSDFVVHLRLEGSCDGCPSSMVTVKLAIERAIREAAPEIVDVHVEGLTEPAAEPSEPAATSREPNLFPAESLMRPRAAAPAPVPSAGGWATVDGLLGLRPGELRPLEVEGAQVVVCQAGDQLYAYRNACPACGVSVGGGQLADAVLHCPSCSASYDVRLAGRSTTEGELHLDPLPLLSEGGEVRIAVAAEAAR